MSLIADLRKSERPLPLPSKFTSWNGVAYLAAGLLLVAWPGVVQALLFGPEFAGREEGLVRVLGMAVTVIGWLYLFGGRTGGRQVVAASVVNRIVLVPLVLVPLAMTGVFPTLLWPFAVLDPVLGLCAWYLLSREGLPS